MQNQNIKDNSNFIKTIIENDLKNHVRDSVITRFPPEPNGYLHIGHAKSICINFSLAQEFSVQVPAHCNLRFDDTNPEKETQEYMNSIQEDIKWLGFHWHDQVKYASDYFNKLYEYAIWFIQQGLAYVDDLTPEQMREYRGTLTVAGKNSPYRDRSIEENLKLFTEMANGDFPDGARTLRLKIDMKSSNINMRDPVIYRIKHIHHLRSGDKWSIYPMYDYTHCISDALEGITHSICTLEFEDHRPLYDWVVEKLKTAQLLSCHPQQIEFSRLELEYTVTSKRKLAQLVEKEVVTGWGDPRMPTIKGMRQRGYPAAAIRLFAQRCGVSKSPNTVEFELLENSVREVLENTEMPKLMAVTDPLKIILTNYDETQVKSREISLDPHHKNSDLGTRECVLTKEIYIMQQDFMLNPIEGFHRLKLNSEVRLRHSYIIKCNQVVQDENGNIKELHCSIDYATLGVNPTDRKVKGVIGWVSASNHHVVEINNYDRLFTKAWFNSDDDIFEYINQNSLVQVQALVEPYSAKVVPGTTIQFERIGYFIATECGFNRIVELKNRW